MLLVAVILAAGKGTRMGSDLPKVLHRFLGEPLVVHPIRAARAAGAEAVVVIVGHGAAEVEAALADQPDLRFALQSEQRGTGHAVQCALPALADHAGSVLILSGDVPRLRPATLHALAAAAALSRGGLALATFTPPDPTGYGRIVRDGAGEVVAIVEERDASPAQRAIGRKNSNPARSAICAAERLSSQPAFQRSGTSVMASPPSALAEKTPSFSRLAPLSGCVIVPPHVMHATRFSVFDHLSTYWYCAGRIFQA